MKPQGSQKSSVSGKKVFDVARPGKTPATPGARPVITNRKSIEDPDVSTKRSLMNPKQKVTVEPVEAEAGDAPTPIASQPKEQRSAEPADSPTKESKPEPKAPVLKAESAEQPQDEQAPKRPPVEPNDEPKASEPPVEPEKPATNEPIEPLHMDMPKHFGTGQAVVSQHNKSRRRTPWVEILAILLILLLLVVIVNLLLDGQIIETDLNIPHTDFFKEST